MWLEGEAGVNGMGGDQIGGQREGEGGRGFLRRTMDMAWYCTDFIILEDREEEADLSSCM